MLDVCAGLTPGQFGTRFEMGPGSLHDTLTHLIAAQRRWADRLSAWPLRPSIDRPPRGIPGPSEYRERSVAELIELFEPAAEDLAAIAQRLRSPGGLGLESTVELALDGTVYVMTRGAALVHVTVHGAHHRAQCLNMLRRLGVARLPELMVVDWQIATGG